MNLLNFYLVFFFYGLVVISEFLVVECYFYKIKDKFKIFNNLFIALSIELYYILLILF